jgi:zinc transport system substrate-binding protein
MTWRALAGMLVVLVSGCASPQARPQPGPTPARVSVVASFYPLYEFTKRIGGDGVDVRNLVPPGVAPHDFEPSARDVAALQGVRALVYNGAGFEPWVAKVLPTLPDTVERVDTTAGLPLLAGGHDDRAPGAGERTAREAAGVDPHVWLDPLLAQRQARRILNALVRVDPARKDLYQANAASLEADLAALHHRIAARLQTCRQRTIVTAHAAFSYFAKRYGLRMIAITGLSPEAEPSPIRLRQVLHQVRQHRVRVIYFETLASPKVAQTIAREVGARTLVLDPVEGLTPDRQAAGATYFTVMHENLQQLAQGLDCP